MAFVQLTYRESLRDIEACLRSQQSKLYHMGIKGGVSRNTIFNANKTRGWRIYAEFALALIHIARNLYVDDDFGVDLNDTIYAFDATTIDLCLSVFPWAQFRSTKGAVKLHTLMDLSGDIPTFIHVSDGNLHDLLVPEAGALYILGRGYTGFARLYMLNLNAAFLRYSWQIQSAMPPCVLTSGGQRHRAQMRSESGTDWFLHSQGLAGQTMAHQISRCKSRQNACLSDQ